MMVASKLERVEDLDLYCLLTSMGRCSGALCPGGGACPKHAYLSLGGLLVFLK